jgi:indole-3-acetate monooxygenase
MHIIKGDADSLAFDRAPDTSSKAVFRGPESLLSAIQTVTSEISQRSREIEDRLQLPRDLFERISATGLFRMMIASKFGGADYTLPDVIPIIEEFGRVDGSTAWSMMLGTEIHVAWTRFPDALLEEIYAAPNVPMTRGALTPKGKVTKTQGGYVLDGQWPLASGSYPTDWFLVAGLVVDGSGQPIHSPDNIVDLLLLAVPAADVEILDTWHAMGMRSTESHDIRFRNYFVPETRTAFHSAIRADTSLVGRLPLYAAFSTFHLAVLLGIARGMIDDLAINAKTKRPVLSPQIVQSQSPLFRTRFAALEIRLSAARALVVSEATKLWGIVNEGGTVSAVDSARYRSMAAHVHHECLAIANDVFSDAGTASLYEGSSIQRRFRDMRTACQHVNANRDIFEFYGALILGEDIAFNGNA